MTTIDEARASTCERWTAQWGSTTPFTFENETTFAHDKSAVAWARLTVKQTGGQQDCLGPAGGRIWERRASAFVQVYSPVNKGMKQGAALAHQARNIFEGESFEGLDFEAGQVRELGHDGKWYQHLVEVEFRYYETK